MSETAARFWSKVDRRGPDECWPWTAFCHQGYGRFRLNGTMVRSHRVAYELLVGPIPDGLVIDHLCRNRGCQNPAHMEPVTPAENQRRGLSGILRTHCPQGHPYNEENTYWHRGRRQCRACHRARGRIRSAATRVPPRTHCKRGHEYTPETTYWNPATGRRRCSICAKAYYAARYARRKAVA